MNKIKFILLLCGVLIGATAYSFEGDNDATIKLEESVITTSGFERTVRNTTSNVTIVTSEQIDEKGYKSLEQLLDAQPSVSVSDDGFGAKIDLRGQGSNKALYNVEVLVDGVSINPLNKSHTYSNLNNISVESIERVEIIPGGGAILYGNGTAGGVVNIITKTSTGYIPFNNVNLEFGSYNRKEYNLSAGTVINDNLLIQTNVSVSESDAFVDTETSDNFVASVLTRYKINEKSDIDFKFEATEKNTSDDSTTLTEKQYASDRNQSGGDGDPSVTGIEKETMSVNYTNRLTDNLTLTTQIVYQELDQDADGLNMDEERLDIKPKLRWSYGNGSSLILGYDYLDNEVIRNKDMYGDGTNIFDLTFGRETHSLFALNSYKIGKFDLIQGARHTSATALVESTYTGTPKKNIPRTEKDLDSYAYELAANYLYSDTGSTYIKWESGFILPSGTSIFNNPITDPSSSYYYEHSKYEVGLSDVKEEKYNTFEIGLKEFVGNTYVSLSAYYSVTDDEVYTSGNSLGTISYNIDETERYGAELNLEHYIGNLTLSEGYSYVDATISKSEDKDVKKGNSLPGVSEHTLSFSAKYSFNPNFNIILSSKYKSDSYLESDNKHKADSYVVTDLIFNHELDNGLKLSFGINNLFNEKYASRTIYSEGSKSDPYVGYKYKAADERNYFMSASYKF